MAAYKKDLELASALVSIDSANEVKTAELTLPSSSTADGVIRLTAYDEHVRMHSW